MYKQTYNLNFKVACNSFESSEKHVLPKLRNTKKINFNTFFIRFFKSKRNCSFWNYFCICIKTSLQVSFISCLSSTFLLAKLISE